MSHWNFYNGLDEVAYYVGETSTRFVIARGDSKEEALGNARTILTKWLTIHRLHAECAKHNENALEASKRQQREHEEAREKHRQEIRARAGDTVKSMPKRRKRIFDESGGKCHYCSTALTLDGKWHIEHKMPKALMGGNEPGNLVASCVTCNHRKRDKTDVEFKAQLVREQS